MVFGCVRVKGAPTFIKLLFFYDFFLYGFEDDDG